jgi:hypothetical protein
MDGILQRKLLAEQKKIFWLVFLIKAGFPNKNIPAYGFFLITPQSGYTGSVVADTNYSQTSNYLAANNTVILYSDQKTTIVDKVGYGSALDYETAPYPNNPPNNQSIERGLIGYDSDDNSADFIIKENPTPTNSSGDGMPAQMLIWKRDGGLGLKMKQQAF